MTGDDVPRSVREDNETALSRLGSSKALFAKTGGDLGADEVLRTAADDAAGAADVFGEWADDDPDGEAAEAFALAAERASDQLDTVLDEVGGEYDPDTGGPVADHLRTVEGTAARAGALLGWSVVSDETLGQVVGFFVGDADPQMAQTFRGVREETGAVQDAALDLLGGVEDAEAAKPAADAVVEVAYEDYVATLEGMGRNPKDVC
jgi:hypothetical protein